MSEEKAPALTSGDLALRAAVAHRVLAKVQSICQPVIDANSEHIKNSKGLRSTSAELPGDGGAASEPVATFSIRKRRPFFYIKDQKAWVDYAEQHGEMEFVVRPAFEKNMLSKWARWDKATQSVIDSRTGEVVQGIGRDPGGEVLGVGVSWPNEGDEAIDQRLEFIDSMLTHLPELTTDSFTDDMRAAR
jgi:hypothetical protein